jgi:Aspartyl protease
MLEPPSIRRGISVSIRVFVILAASVAIIGLARPAPANAAENCQLKQFASIPTTIGAGGRILLDVAIDDEPAKLLVDTGAGFSMLDPGYIKRRSLPTMETQTLGYGLTGRGLSGATRVGTLKLGNAVSRNGVFGIGSTGGDGSDDRPVGLFAADYLANYDVEIDPAAAQINLFSQDHCTGNVVYWAKEYFRLPVSLNAGKQMVVNIDIDGKTLRALIDTGASTSVMRLAVARRLFDISADVPDGQRLGKSVGVDATKIDTFMHVFDSLTFGGITLRNTKMAIAAIDSGKGAFNNGSHISGMADQEDVLIGMPLLRQLHLFIAYSEPALYFTVAEPKPGR